jgi:hypothetical protein
MQSFRNLRVWEKAHRLTLDVYGSTRTFPREEIYGLTSQLRRGFRIRWCQHSRRMLPKGRY